jgi:purine-cytosine permease-like protein
MRWKVLILASLAAAIAGVGLALIITLVCYNSLSELVTHGLPAMGTLTILLMAIAFAGFFVYRHTARRRKLQTTLAVLFTLVFTAAAFALGSFVTPKLHLSRAPAARGIK